MARIIIAAFSTRVGVYQQAITYDTYFQTLEQAVSTASDLSVSSFHLGAAAPDPLEIDAYPVCSEADCVSEIYARDLCSKHYRRRKIEGTLPPKGDTGKKISERLRVLRQSGKLKRGTKSSSKICSVEGCVSKTSALGYCKKHYKRYAKHGTAEGEGRLIACVIPGIGSWKSRNDCARHFGQWDCSNWTSYAKRDGLSYEHYVVLRLKDRVRQAATRLERWKRQKEAEEERRLEEEMRLRYLATDPDVLVWGRFTPLRFCKHCGERAGRGWPEESKQEQYDVKFNAVCGPCGKEKDRESRKADRKRRRRLGLTDRGKHVVRARRYGVRYEPGITAITVAKRDGWTCQLCGEPVHRHAPKGVDLRGATVGHIKPLSLGGPHVWSNVQCECWECNTLKGARELTREQFQDVRETLHLEISDDILCANY